MKYWVYHSWPSATRDKSIIFTRDDHNHTWYFPLFFASHILISHSYVCTTPCINYIHVEYIAYESHREGQEIVQYYLLQSNNPLFRNKEFLVNLKTERNASKFAMFMEKENPCSFFRFSFRATFIFPLWMPWSMST